MRCRGRYAAWFHLRHPGSGLPQSQERAPIAAIPGLIPACEAAGISRRVAPLTFQVIAPSSEIEPDNRILGAMALRLGFIAERRKALRHRAVRRTRNNGQKRSGTAVEPYPHLVPTSSTQDWYTAAPIIPILSTPCRSATRARARRHHTGPCDPGGTI